MIIKNVEFPEQLILDQRAGKLVIFAGAGVSLDSPSSLPTFVRLTEQIVSRKLKKKEKQQLDRILGAHKQAGLNVHRIAKEIIDKEGSRPTKLHEALLMLFSDSGSIRVVTTNFDRHFSTAAQNLFSNSPEEYYAPALPLGHDFKGVVYLHGSLERDEQRFVLTDSDFGRAYLTEGWATRFLWELFRTYTILFVGYSHNDPVMHYLSKGLPSETIGKRYALTPENDIERWKDFFIEPLAYPIVRGTRKHKALTVAVEGWAKMSRMGALNYEHRIKSIVQGAPYLSEEDSDFLLFAVTHAGYARFFVKYAEQLEWLDWAERNDLLKPLFQPNGADYQKYNAVLAEWITDRFLLNQTDSVLALIQRQGQHLNPIFWNTLAWDLVRKELQSASNIISRIIPIFLQSPQPVNWAEPLAHILTQLNLPENKDVVLLLFTHLTTPQIELQRSFSMGDEENKVAPELDIRLPEGNDHYWLRTAWESKIAPHIECCASELEAISAANLSQADMLRRSYRGPSSFDPISFRRSAIEVHEQDEHPGKLDVLINVARDSVGYLIENDPDIAFGLINRWFGNTSEIMRRIALNALAECTVIAADLKIEWLANRGLLFDVGCVHEVFRVIQMAYPDASDGARENLIKAVVGEGSKGEDFQELDAKTERYEIFNFLYWLKLADPSCSRASHAFAMIQQANPEFQPREHPDFHHWSCGAHWVGHQSPLTVEELLDKAPEDELEFFLTYKGDHFEGPDREGLLNSITQAVQQNFDWAYRLSQVLADTGVWDTDIWPHILRGWEDGLEEDGDLCVILRFLLENPELRKHHQYIASLIQKRFQDKKPASGASLALAMQLAERLMDYLETVPDGASEVVNDWLQVAINHSGGKLAEFWFKVLSRTRKDFGETWVGLPEIPHRCLNKMVAGSSFEAQLAKVVIASQLYFIFYMDSSWAVSKVLPLFEWSDPLRARQCWDGYLFWGRYGENTLPHIMPLYRKTFHELHVFPDMQRRQFCQHMASIAIYSSVNPLEDGWLQEFISAVEAQDRAEWASQLRGTISGLEDEAIKLLWEQWLGKYWHRRNLGQPAPLAQSELKEMVKWSTHLGIVFDKAVKMICESPAPEISEGYVFNLMLKNGFAVKHTKDLATLLIHLLPRVTKEWLCHDLIPLAKALRDAELDSASLDKIRHGLIALCDEGI
ncbi:DUF4020 domain-containing protein [Desulfurivibrio sp. C05AmB]|uniref:DUF4020 domain-containing protein n=1 Tax=Desulfurivibrio sp. C05AmB TaxID=3374371 RepID=UPI00376F1046